MKKYDLEIINNTKEMKNMYSCGYYNGTDIKLTQIELDALHKGKVVACDIDESTIFISLDKSKGENE